MRSSLAEKQLSSRLAIRPIGLAFAILPSFAYGAVLHVPEQYPTITLAANAAVSGDSVLVDHPSPNGEYTAEAIVIKSGVSIIGEDHDSTPVLIYHSSIVFAQGDTPARLERFAIIAPYECSSAVVSSNPRCEIRFNQIHSSDNPACPESSSMRAAWSSIIGSRAVVSVQEWKSGEAPSFDSM